VEPGPTAGRARGADPAECYARLPAHPAPTISTPRGTYRRRHAHQATARPRSSRRSSSWTSMMRHAAGCWLSWSSIGAAGSTPSYACASLRAGGHTKRISRGADRLIHEMATSARTSTSRPHSTGGSTSGRGPAWTHIRVGGIDAPPRVRVRRKRTAAASPRWTSPSLLLPREGS